MKRKFTIYQVENPVQFRQKMLNWSGQFNIFCLLDNHQYNSKESDFDCMLAVGVRHSFNVRAGNAFDDLQEFVDTHHDWIFGHLSYDLKNEIENLHSRNPDHIGFPDMFFFIPEIIIKFSGSDVLIGMISGEANDIFASIESSEPKAPPRRMQKATGISNRTFLSKFTREEYLQTISNLKSHIRRGDCYEINFCQEFYAVEQTMDPFETYIKLSRISPNPFAALYRINDKYCISSSPERYLKRVGDQIISQPIKGTSARNIDNVEEDHRNRQSLLNKKERAENVMTVDLVRNDLAKICKEGSVTVSELFGIYQFPQVYQMISTITGRIDPKLSIGRIFISTFPMGSMTGAPKLSVMKLIEKYEHTKRGLFSGAIGYITPEKDFDFNVVIRSILYNASNKYISIQAGSAITINSEATDEYLECLLKISALKAALE